MIRLFPQILPARLALSLLVSLLVASAPVHAEPDKVAVVLDGKKIRLSDIRDEAVRIARAEGQPIPPKSLPVSVRNRTLEQIITRDLLFKAAMDEPGISREAIRAEAKAVVEDFARRPSELREFLDSAGIDVATFEEQTFSDLLVAAYVTKLAESVRVNEMEVREAYERDKKQAVDRDSQLRLAHIIIHGEDNVCSPLAERARIQIEQVYNEVTRPFSNQQDKGHHFFTIARKWSDSPTRVYGGYLGRKGRGRFDSRVEDVAFSLRENEISKPFRVKGDWYIVWVIERIEPEFTPYENLKLGIAENLLVEKRDLLFRKTIKGLLEEAKMEVLIPDWHFDI